MAEPPTSQPSGPPPQTAGTVADIMRPPVTTPRQNDHAAAAWIGGLLAVFIPLSVWRYRRMS